MARTPITVQDVTAPFEAVTAGSADFTFAAATATDFDEWICNGRDLLLVFNGSGGALTLTIHSVDDEKGRAENITTYSLADGDYAAFGIGLTNSKGWQQTDRTIHIDGSAVGVTFAILRLPAGFP